MKLNFGYSLSKTTKVKDLSELNSSKSIISQSLNCVLDSKDFKSAIENAVAKNNNSALVSTTGALAEAFYQEIPKTIIEEACKKIPKDIKKIAKSFYGETCISSPKISEMLLGIL